jgi:transposase InsO family protein
VPRSPPQDFVDLAAIAAGQPGCADTMSLVSSPSLRVVPLAVEGVRLLCDTSTGSIRPLVPAPHRRSIFTAVHSLAHPGIRATRRLISTRWLWRGMAADVAAWCRECQPCQRGKVTQQHTAAVEPIAVPHRRFSHIHADIVGPLPSSQGFHHLLTIIDRSTRWLEAIPLQSTTAAAVADALTSGWIARFGVPAELTTDRGVQFTSEIWSILMNRLGIRHHQTTAYHPQANGMIERAHRQLKDALRSRLAGADWLSHLPWVLLGLRSVPKEDSGISSAELVYGSPILLPGDIQHGPEPPPSVFALNNRSFPSSIPTRRLSPSGTSSPPSSLQQAEFVYVRRGGSSPPLSPAYSGPYRVVERFKKYYVLEMGPRQEAVSIDRLKPHLGAAPVVPAAVPRRGRPSTSSSSSAPRPGSSLGPG